MPRTDIDRQTVDLFVVFGSSPKSELTSERSGAEFTPDVIVIDEIGTAQEMEAACSIGARGVSQQMPGRALKSRPGFPVEAANPTHEDHEDHDGGHRAHDDGPT